MFVISIGVIQLFGVTTRNGVPEAPAAGSHRRIQCMGEAYLLFESFREMWTKHTWMILNVWVVQSVVEYQSKPFYLLNMWTLDTTVVEKTAAETDPLHFHGAQCWQWWFFLFSQFLSSRWVVLSFGMFCFFVSASFSFSVSLFWGCTLCLQSPSAPAQGVLRILNHFRGSHD